MNCKERQELIDLEYLEHLDGVTHGGAPEDLAEGVQGEDDDCEVEYGLGNNVGYVVLRRFVLSLPIYRNPLVLLGPQYVLCTLTSDGFVIDESHI